MSWGIRPDAMIGHSIGEFVAAVLAEVMSLEDALALVAARGRLMQELPGGAMLAVRLPESEVRTVLTPTLSIAAINGPALCVVSGPFDAVDALEKSLQARNVVSRRLHTSHAFHSAMVDPVVEPLRRQLQEIKLSPAAIPYVSCVTGDWIRPEQATSPQYWARHAREIVRFADGVATVSAGASAVLLEVGPGNALSTLALQTTRGRGVPVISSMQDAARERSDRECLLEALGRMWTLGAAPDWTAVHGGVRRPHIPLPTYPFQRVRHWIDAPRPVRAGLGTPTEIAVETTLQPHSTQEVSAMNQSPIDDRIGEVRTLIAAIFEDLSGERPESTDTDTTFLEMGYDSLFLTQVAQKVQSQTGVKITFRQLLGDYSTIPTLAGFLADKMPKPAPKAAPAMPVATPAAAVAAALPAPMSPQPLRTVLPASLVPQS
jgi:acyl transferase domain-containing protein